MISVGRKYKIKYKRASIEYNATVLSGHQPSLDSQTLRLTFVNIQDTNEMASRWEEVQLNGSAPDFCYLNVGAWKKSCDIDKAILSQ